jgi:CheY-like chemotaxis protein
VLVVDDNRDSAETLTLLVRRMGHEVATAYDGLDAVERAASFQPEIVLLDIGLPRLNGYDAARRIRERVPRGAITLIAVTGWGQDQDRRRSKEAGFDFHVVKPVDPDDLETLLADVASDPDRC